MMSLCKYLIYFTSISCLLIGLSQAAINVHIDEELKKEFQVGVPVINPKPKPSKLWSEVKITAIYTDDDPGICCTVEPSIGPIFDQNGNIKFYRQNPCLIEFVKCCSGYLSILGKCTSMEKARELYPIWKEHQQKCGCSLEEAIKLSGTIQGSNGF